ncbi:hypothetical protein [Planococcus lenghuensis]|uniref:Uncharacterized protein n=1 Tax=Planococcus lenghuensis TaxID=2213202 RepID=A0A1Q2KZ96_9BACL|nr:hypothetical protein [Planococcus lenghuensis]AQQ53466.1 hypothetical protein B0X71_10530 [Planococcus lenghuensis]
MNTTLGKFLLVCSLFFILASFFAPFVLLTIFQQLFIQPEQTWFFGSPFLNYGIYFVAFLIIGIAIGVFRYVFFNSEKTKMATFTCFAAALVPAFMALSLSANHYYYFDEEGIHQNGLFQLTEEIHPWKDVEKMTVVTEDTAGGTKPVSMVFTERGGEEILFPLTAQLIRKRNLLESRLVEMDVTLDAIYRQSDS